MNKPSIIATAILRIMVVQVILIAFLINMVSATPKVLLGPSGDLNAFEVSGLVKDGTGQPIPGANVVEKGTTNGTVTDTAGKYTITVSDGGATLVFSFIGYAIEEVSVAGRANIDITLTEDIKTLSEVVVVGYGTQKKSDLTGAISSVKSEDLKMLPTQRADQALQGRAAGVLVLNTDGAPGGNTTIRIRGSNSVLGGNNALVVVDGLQSVNLSTINPNDIQSIEVLKDASATAIYGSRGANGVILVTTKQGGSGKASLFYAASFGWQELGKKLDMLNAADFARMANLNKSLANVGPPPILPFTDGQISGFEKNGGTDWQDEIYRKAPIQNHQLSINGGTQNLKYFVSGGYVNQDGIVLNSGYKRYTLRANLNLDINKWLSYSLNFSGVKDEGKTQAFGQNSGPVNGVITSALRWDAATPPYDEDGNYTRHPVTYGVTDVWNPMASALEPDLSVKNVTNYINTALNFKILKGLTLNVSGMATLSNSKNASYYNERTIEGIAQANGTLGYGTLSNGQYERYQNTNILTYDKTISSHHFTVTGVAEQSVEHFYGSSLVAQQFTVGQTGLNDLAGAGLINNFSNASKRVINSYLGRVNYSYKGKYLLTASYRADGSSVFGANNKWGYFPSVSVAWNLKEESFMKSANLITDMKVRASMGTTGNQAISPYQTFASIGSGQNYPWSGGSATEKGFGIVSAENADLKWEKTRQTNIGLDASLMAGRLTLTVDVYKKETSDLLLYRQLPGSTGLGAIIDNVGSTENKGLEISIGGDPVVGPIQWNTGFNISFNRNKVVNLGADEKIPYIGSTGGYNVNRQLMELQVGKPFGQVTGWGFEGIWGISQSAEAAVYGQLPGDPRYTDVDGDGIININDIVVIGNTSPDFSFGWSNRVSYKNFDLNFLIQGTYGNDIFNQNRIVLELQHQPGSTRVLDYWTPDNQDTDIPGYIDQATRIAAGLNNTVTADAGNSRYIENGSYVRLKNVTLGYSLPASNLSLTNIISKLRVYVSATNLFTITDYTGYDPEVSSFTGSDAQLGIDSGNYPSAKTYLFGVELTF